MLKTLNSKNQETAIKSILGFPTDSTNDAFAAIWRSYYVNRSPSRAAGIHSSALSYAHSSGEQTLRFGGRCVCVSLVLLRSIWLSLAGANLAAFALGRVPLPVRQSSVNGSLLSLSDAQRAIRQPLPDFERWTMRVDAPT